MGGGSAEERKRKGGPWEDPRRWKRKVMGKEEEKVLSKQHGFNLLTLAAFSLALVVKMRMYDHHIKLHVD